MIKTAFSTQASAAAAVAELKQQSAGTDPRVILCFASPRYDPAALSQELKTAFPKACIAGCTTAGEIVSGKMLSGSVVAMFLDSAVVGRAACAIVEHIAGGAGARAALSTLASEFGMPLSAMDIQKYAGIVLFDGLSGAEERLMEEIGDLTDLFFVGGSAGDDLAFKSTHVFANGVAYTDAALLLLLEIPGGFDIIKTQSFVPAGKTLVATEVDVPNRTVIRFDGKPAVTAYAEAVGAAPEKAAGEFMLHPLGLMVDGQPYVRSPQRVQDQAMAFYCRINEGAELQVLNGTDILADTRAALAAKLAEMGQISGIVDFHCILRTLELRAEKRCDEYGRVFGDIPAVGFSTYGEAYLGHINQTSTMLVLR